MTPKDYEVIYKITVAQTVHFPSALNWNAEPVGELIRCKDCKWNTADEWVHCAMLGGMFGRTTDNYCSLGERKEE